MFWLFSALMVDRKLFGARATLINSFIQRSQVSYLAVSCLADRQGNLDQAVGQMIRPARLVFDISLDPRELCGILSSDF